MGPDPVGVLKAKMINNDTISVNLGKLSYNWKDIPLAREVDTLSMPIKLENFSSGVAINIGNPHLVFFGNDLPERQRFSL